MVVSRAQSSRQAAILKFPQKKKKLQGVQQIACLKQKHVLSFTFYKTHRPYKKIMCIYLLFHWFSGENFFIFIFSLHKGRQTSAD